MGPSCRRPYCIAHSTGATGVSRSENVDRADQIGVFPETTSHVLEPGLRPPVAGRHVAAQRACPARVLGRRGDEIPAMARKRVIQFAAELKPALAEDKLVEVRPGRDFLARLFDRTCRRPGHSPHLQVPDTHHRVVRADRGCGLAQKVVAGFADTGVDAPDTNFRFLPVGAEPSLAARGLPCLAQSRLVPPVWHPFVFDGLKSSHSSIILLELCFKMNVHSVFVAKDRRRVFDGNAHARLCAIAGKVSAGFGAQPIGQDGEDDQAPLPRSSIRPRQLSPSS